MTNLAGPNNNVTNLTIENTNYGKIVWYNTNLTTNWSIWQNYVSIGPLSIEVDSVQMPQLNSPATITFYNVNFNRPEVLLNGGIHCNSASCYDYNATTQTLTMKVNGFSEYTIREYVAPKKSSSGGGGGGSSSAKYLACDIWGAWSACTQGTQTRGCSETKYVKSSEQEELTQTQACVVITEEPIIEEPTIIEEEVAIEEPTETNETPTSYHKKNIIGIGAALGIIAIIILTVFLTQKKNNAQPVNKKKQTKEHIQGRKRQR
jgi:hypothetical protein